MYPIDVRGARRRAEDRKHPERCDRLLGIEEKLDGEGVGPGGKPLEQAVQEAGSTVRSPLTVGELGRQMPAGRAPHTGSFYL